MNNVQIFKSERFGEIRTAGTAEQPEFCLSDVCKALDLQAAAVTRRLPKDVISNHPLSTAGGTQSFTFVNEDGLYDVILDSRKPEAKVFRKWVTSEVLPSIRKTGGYIGGTAGMSDEEIMAKALDIAHRTIERKAQENKMLKEDNLRLENENIQLAAENQDLRNDKNYLDLIMRSKALVTISQIAQDYGMSGKAMNKKLADMGIQYSLNGQWILYAKYKARGYVSSRSIDIVRAGGQPDVVLHTEWTQTGRRFLYEELKKDGIVPLLERR